MKHLEKEGNFFYIRAQDAVDVWLGCLAVALKLNKVRLDELWLPRMGCRYLLTSCNCTPQTNHNDFEHSHVGNLDCFLLVTEAQSIFI